MTNLLFVCTNNKHRSVTAADMLDGVKVKRGDPRWVAFDEAGHWTEEYETKSAGLAPTCENPVTKELLEWADESRDKFNETDCHEMVHVWQIATGRMKDTWRGGYKQLWKCKDGKYRNYGKTSYERQPWETEAYAMEGKLAELFKKYEKNC